MKTIKSLQIALPLALLSLSTLAFGQSGADKSFDRIKSLAGTWEGALTTVPAAAAEHREYLRVSLRETSSGNAVLHEMKVQGAPDDPITMLYVDGNRLFLRHYCDAGNRPRMVATASPDGKTITFNVVDVSGSKSHGYMEHVVFTAIDASHHTEDWTFLLPGNHAVQAHFDLHRVQ